MFDVNGINMISGNLDNDLIRILYRQMVGREADSEGLAYHIRSLEGRPDFAAREELVRGMLQSDEAANHLVRRLYLRASPDSSLNNKEIVSLGTHCFTSFLLKSFGLKAYSGPFDWLFSSPGMVAHCLNDDFNIFLDPSFYEPVPIERRRDGDNVNKVDHHFYREQYGVDYVFNHHNVHEQPDYGYLTRCVERFRSAAKSDSHKIYLCVRKETDTLDDDFDMVASAVERYARNGVLVYVGVGDRAEVMPKISTRRNHGAHRLVLLNPISGWNALTFDDVMDELTILKSIAAVLNGNI